MCGCSQSCSWCCGCTLYLCSVLSPACWWHLCVDLCDGSSTSCCPRVRTIRCDQKAWTEKKHKNKSVALWRCKKISCCVSFSLHLRISSPIFFLSVLPQTCSLLRLLTHLKTAWLFTGWYSGSSSSSLSSHSLPFSLSPASSLLLLLIWSSQTPTCSSMLQSFLHDVMRYLHQGWWGGRRSLALAPQPQTRCHGCSVVSEKHANHQLLLGVKYL